MTIIMVWWKSAKGYDVHVTEEENRENRRME